MLCFFYWYITVQLQLFFTFSKCNKIEDRIKTGSIFNDSDTPSLSYYYNYNLFIIYFKETFNIFNYNYALAFNEDILNVCFFKLTL